MSGLSSFISYLIYAVVTALATKLGQKFIWGNKKEDGTAKSPWAPSPSNASFFTGNYTEFQNQGHEALTRWSKELGDFYSVSLGQKRVNVLNNAHVVREALITKEQLNSCRLPSDTFEKLVTDYCKTVYSAPFTPYWSRLRRAIHLVLKGSYTKYFKEQAKKLSVGIYQDTLTAKELRQLVDMISMDSALSLVFGVAHRDPVTMLTIIQKLQELESIQSSKYNRLGQFFPAINSAMDVKNLFTLNSNVLDLRNSLLELILPWFNPIYQLKGDKPLSEQERKVFMTNVDSIAKSLLNIEPSKNDPEPVQLQKNEILINSLHIVLHAHTFLSSALFTLIQRLATEPELQERLLLTADDSLYYAVVNESLRLNTPTPILTYGPRTDYDFEVGTSSYRVDVDTPLVVNVDAIHHDERYYPHSNKFDPDRFLRVDKKTVSLLEQDDTNKKTARDHLAFGAGRRGCMGNKVSQEFLVSMTKQIIKQYKLKGGDMEQVQHSTSIWSWVGRTETKGSTIEFIKR